MYDFFALIGFLIVIVLCGRSYLITRAQRKPPQVYHNTPKYQSYSGKNCDKLVTKTTKKA